MSITCPVWSQFFKEELSKEYMKGVRSFIGEERKTKSILPDTNEVFTAYEKTPYHKVKIVIVGTEPYSQKGDADGLAFSAKGHHRPKAHYNIFKEISEDCKAFFHGYTHEQCFRHQDLSQWAEQGVFLLNSSLTVEEGKALSHQEIGWNVFAGETIALLNKHTRPIVFMLWGKKAQEMESLITGKHHLTLLASHPVNADKGGFFGEKHFSKANSFIKKIKTENQYLKLPINWGIYNNQN